MFCIHSNQHFKCHVLTFAQYRFRTKMIATFFPSHHLPIRAKSFSERISIKSWVYTWKDTILFRNVHLIYRNAILSHCIHVDFSQMPIYFCFCTPCEIESSSATWDSSMKMKIYIAISKQVFWISKYRAIAKFAFVRTFSHHFNSHPPLNPTNIRN